MGSLLDVLLGCTSFACIVTVFVGIAFHCCPIVEKARTSSRAGIPHPERLEMAAFLVVNLLLGAAGATLFYHGLYCVSDLWLAEVLADGWTVDTVARALGRTIQELSLFFIWVVSATVCVCWTAYTLLAIWEITIPCSASASSVVRDPIGHETNIDLESQVSCTNQARELTTGDGVRVRDDTERPRSGEDTVRSSDSPATPSNPRTTTPQIQPEHESHLMWRADLEMSLSQSSVTAAYTPSASSHSGPRNSSSSWDRSANTRITTDTLQFADAMIRHLEFCPWVESVGNTWQDMGPCERLSGLNKLQTKPAKNLSRAQQRTASAQTVQTTLETRIETTLKNTSVRVSHDTSTATSKITKTTSKVDTGVAPGPSIGVVRPATGQVDNRIRPPYSSFAQHRYPDLPKRISGVPRGRALTDPFKEYYPNTTDYKDIQRNMSPLPKGKDNNCSFPNDPISTTPNPPQAIKPTIQANQPSGSDSFSTAASQSVYSRPTPADLPAPFPTLDISNAHAVSPSRTVTAWETHVLAQEQKRYSQRLRFALETQYRHIRHSNLEMDMQSALDTYRSQNKQGMQTVRSVSADAVWRARDSEFDEYPFAWDRVEARRLEEQWRRRRGQLDGGFRGRGKGRGW